MILTYLSLKPETQPETQGPCMSDKWASLTAPWLPLKTFYPYLPRTIHAQKHHPYIESSVVIINQSGLFTHLPLDRYCEL
jgi:hypothetical protein